MKTTARFWFAVAVACALQTTFAQELDQRFVSPVGYEINLPTGWRRTDKKTLEKGFKELSGGFPNARLLQEAVDGFQLESSQGEPGYPNITVIVARVGKTSFQDLKEMASSLQGVQRGADSGFAGNSFQATASVDSAGYDEQGHFLRITSTASAPGVGRIRGITVVFPMDIGILEFQFFSTEGDYSQYAALFSRVIRGIKKTVPTAEGVGIPPAQPAKRVFSAEDFGLTFSPHRNPADSATPATVSTAPAMQPAKTDEFGGVAVDPVPVSAAPASQAPPTTAISGEKGAHEMRRLLTDAEVGLAPAPNAATTNKLTELETFGEKAREGAAVGEPAQPDTTAPSGRIRVISPGGVKGTIPVDQLNAALRAGYELLGGREQHTHGVVGVPTVAEKAWDGAAVTNKLAEVQALAEKGDAKSQFGLGVCYDEGKGVAKDAVEAVKWYRKAAEQNLPEAEYILGNSYDQGGGVERNYAEAVKWYRKAAKQGLAVAQFSLGFYYANGRGVVKDDVEAVKWYRKAAEQNLGVAQFSLGVCYDDGLGVVKDKAEAVKWYRRAAEQNEVQAQYNLGFHYLNGEGVIRNGVEAAKWFRKAAEQNDAKSQFGLGVCYANGEGVEKDYVEAYAWFNLAAKTKENAAMNRDDLEKTMSPQQVAAAQKRTKELRTQIEAKSKIGGPGHSAH